VTTGVVSALDRSVRAEDRVYRHFIQTDASITPATAADRSQHRWRRDRDQHGDLPEGARHRVCHSDQPKQKIGERNCSVRRSSGAWLGVDLQELTPELSAISHSGRGRRSAVSMCTGTALPDRAGVKRGDIVLAVGGTAVSTLSDYQDALAEFTTGDASPSSFSEEEKTLHPLAACSFSAGTRPGNSLSSSGPSRWGRGRTGNAQQRSGVSVEEVKQDSEAARIGLKQET